MEWIRISSNKLKIMLTAEDARRYALNCENADYADVVTRAAFREILNEVGEQTGFDAVEDKVYIQMYPSKEGGCELFVTRIGLLLSESNDAQENASCPEAQKQHGKHTVLLFDELSPLLQLCRRMKKMYCVTPSEAWKDEEGRWWLVLARPLAKRLQFALEYGRCVPAEKALLFLQEHARAVCPTQAIETLGEL